MCNHIKGFNIFARRRQANSTNRYITGRRLFGELGTCNYTTLTFAKPAQGGLIYIIAAVAVLFAVASCLCTPQGVCFGWLLWAILFPMVVMWTAYGVSPLCFPMLPPQFPRDIATGIERLLPSQRMEIPRFLVAEDCTVRGRLSDGTFDTRCFKQCSAAPFYMIGWQDTLAWWLCDLSPHLARAASDVLTGSWFQDFASSAAYYADVIEFGDVDPEFVAAHRLCAFLASHTLVFGALAGAIAVIVLPTIVVAIAEVFAASVALLFSASGAQILTSSDETVPAN